MRILNVMFSRGQGGIEQSFLDYTSALALAGHDVHTLTRPNSWANGQLMKGNLPLYTLPNWGAWDLVAARRITRLLEQVRPDIIIAHGNRALTLMSKAARLAEGKPLFKTGAPPARRIPVVGVAHNDSIHHFTQASAAFAVTKTLCRKLVESGLPESRVFHIPNMINASSPPSRKPYHHPPVIGALGRLIEDKSLHVLVVSLAMLKARGVSFRAVFAGEGKEKEPLRAYAHVRGIADEVKFPGWVDDKDAFFSSIDILCLPSRRESFGIVLLEAFARGVPVIVSDADGPKEIITSGKDGMVVGRGDATALAEAISTLLADEAKANTLVQNAWQTLQAHYITPVVSTKLDAAIRTIFQQLKAA